jgi:RNA ligase
MTLLADVLDPVALAAAVEMGHVRKQSHPSRPHVIYNYTEACQHAGAWTPVTLACRGLIVDESSGEVLARPYENSSTILRAARLPFAPTHR